jgi:hypothetical protein
MRRALRCGAGLAGLAPKGVFLLLAAVAFGALPQPGRAAADPCPAAPHGWKAAASNPTVFGPAQQPGQQHMMISCQYDQAPKHTVSVIAEYALPADPNPIADFYFGCDVRRHQEWTASGRSYFAASGKRWSYVEFTDPSGQLPDAAAGGFEKVAGVLLKRVSSSAHACKVNTTTPTLVQHLYLFGFEFLLSSPDAKAFGGIATQSKKNLLIPAASFTTTSDPNATVLANVKHVDAKPVTVQVVRSGAHRSLTLRFPGGIDFYQRPPVQRLRLRVEVARSSVSGCPARSSGTLTITRSSLLNSPNAPAVIRLQLCGSLFAHGTYRGTALIISG